ncbi:MAG: hypothetical protein OEO20_14215 [Gemmatimonadota bacterium]|nr:hypothetical protein [Gemmatimonadota bacterium]MDH3368108.1 hypothetical protein [Gemmatimonadota bacterium]MDH3479447.1 hypothetical protein [Gemmatimonadota bacterium]
MLIVSNPPHRPGDRSAAVWCFDISPLEVAAKAAYAVPEIWFADSDRGVLAEISKVLEAVGLSTLWVREEELATVPAPTTVDRVEFDDRGLTLEYGASQMLVRRTTPVIAVVCRPSVSVGREAMPAAAETAHDAEIAAFVDLYVRDSGVLRRFSVMQGLVDLAPLDDPERQGSTTMATFAEMCEQRFPRARIDQRLVGTRVRRRRLPTDLRSASERRAGFSFGTNRLQRLLESIAPDLADVTQNDLASRLIYLTLR